MAVQLTDLEASICADSLELLLQLDESLGDLAELISLSHYEPYAPQHRETIQQLADYLRGKVAA